MAIDYDFYESPNPMGDGETKYHVRPVGSRTLQTKNFVTQIQKECSLTVSDVLGCLSALSSVLSRSLLEGNRVKLDGIGSFGISLNGNVKRDAKGQLRLKDGKVSGVTFRPENSLINNLKTYGKLTNSNHLGKRSTEQTYEEVKKKLEAYFETNTILSYRGFCSLIEATKSTALRFLKRLKADGLLKNIERGIYVHASSHFSSLSE
ncbi:MAG: hypothetical protein RR386_02795 [Bacteroidaceae bacterium]